MSLVANASGFESVEGSDPPKSPDWREVCALDRITPDRGVAALFGSLQVAIFWLSTGQVVAVDNFDPFSGANVMARGLVGDADGNPKVVSPIYKQSFDLTTGVCLTDSSVSLRLFPVDVRGGRVYVDVAV